MRRRRNMFQHCEEDEGRFTDRSERGPHITELFRSASFPSQLTASNSVPSRRLTKGIHIGEVVTTFSVQYKISTSLYIYILRVK